jgi:ubiquitin carboxyl-terminal hydrolase 8
MPVPHPVMLSEQIQPVFGISDTSGSSSANGGITLKPSPVYIVGQQAIGNITSNPTNGDSQTIASLPPTIASRIASLNQAGMVDQAKVPPITLNNKNINSTKSLDSVSKPAITTSIHAPGSMQMPEPPSSSFETKRDPLADFPITNTIKPSELLHWLRVEKNPPKILVLDVRNRDQFKNGHIKTQNIVCLEPIILQDHD